MKHYVHSYWTKYKQLYKKGLKGIAAFLAIGAIIVFVLATIASRGGHYPLLTWYGRIQKAESCSQFQMERFALICGT